LECSAQFERGVQIFHSILRHALEERTEQSPFTRTVAARRPLLSARSQEIGQIEMRKKLQTTRSKSSGSLTTLTPKEVINCKISATTAKIVKDAFSRSLKPNKKKEFKRKQLIPDTPYTKVPKLDPMVQSLAANRTGWAAGTCPGCCHPTS